MAGEMGNVPRRPGLSLGERTAISQPSTTNRRHCWVTGPSSAPGPWPGLVVEWRRDGDTWLGRVVYVVTDEEPPVLVEAWLSASQLRAVIA